MCAPGDQRKSMHNQRELAELDALGCQRRADVSGMERSSSASRELELIIC